MPQSLANVLVHMTFSTKDRKPLIRTELRSELNAYLVGVLKQLGSPTIVVNCVADHVHILCCLSKNHALAKVLEEVKKSTSKWIKTRSRSLQDFYWQAGYGAFSVSQSNVDKVRDYIAKQEEHHRKMTFQEELRALLIAMGSSMTSGTYGTDLYRPYRAWEQGRAAIRHPGRCPGLSNASLSGSVRSADVSRAKWGHMSLSAA